MYKFIFVLLVVVGMATASNAQEKQNMKQSDNNPCRIVYKCRSRLE